MHIQHKEGKVKSLFYVEEEGKMLAEMVYSLPTPDKMIIEHTEVDESLSGKGIGKQLVHAAVEWARTNHIKIIPLCPFAKSVFDRTKEWQDVLV